MATKPPRVSRIPRVSKGELVPLFCGLMKQLVEPPMSEHAICPKEHRVAEERGELPAERGGVRLMAYCDDKPIFTQVEVQGARSMTLRDFEKNVLTHHHAQWRKAAWEERLAHPMWQLCSLPHGHIGPHVWELDE